MARHPKPLVARAFLRLAVTFCLLAPTVVAAQDEDPETLAEARRIFGEGLAHSDRHEWHEAVAAFRQVIELRAAPPVLYNLAVALVEIREYPEAQDLLDRVFADETTSPEIRASSEELRGELEAHAGKIELAYRGDPAGVIFFIDGFALGGAALDHPHFAAPGRRSVEARRGAAVLARADVDVVRGETVRAELVSPDAEAAAEAAIADEPTPAEQPSERRGVRNPWLWAGVGAGVAAIVIVAVAVSATRDPDSGPPFDGDFVPGRLTW